MTLKFVVDSDVISETSRPRPNDAVVRWIQAEGRWALTAVTVYELSRGIQLVTSARKRAFLDDWLARVLERSADVLPFDRATGLQAAQLAVRAQRSGKSVSQSDLFIAASAAARGLSLATRNVAHFRGFGIPVFDPFTGSWSI